MSAFDAYLRTDPCLALLVSPLGDGRWTLSPAGRWTLSPAAYAQHPDYWRAAASGLAPFFDAMIPRPRTTNEALASALIWAREFGFNLAHRDSWEIADALTSAVTMLCGERLSDFAASVLRCQAWDGRDVAGIVEGGRRTFH